MTEDELRLELKTCNLNVLVEELEERLVRSGRSMVIMPADSAVEYAIQSIVKTFLEKEGTQGYENSPGKRSNILAFGIVSGGRRIGETRKVSDTQGMQPGNFEIAGGARDLHAHKSEV
ncbi:MAG: hypothetical protein H7A25_22330 [Leptospiraceae bacterium]|nr:hypothetical protein [Leptospiraceae bacterium]MCP5502652.1 hypothetical protein [Leptospiraceae bacterium]